MGERKRRTDLERVPISFPEHMIGEEIIPVIGVENRDQHIYYKLIETGGTATVDRGNSTAMSSRAVVDDEKDITLVMKEDRAHIPMKYVNEHGVKFADIAGATSVKTTLAEKREIDVATLVLGGTGHISAAAGVIDAYNANEESVDRVAGLKVFVTNKKTYNIIMGKAEITDRMKYTGVIGADQKMVRGLAPSVLAAILGCDLVLVGKNEFWNVGDAHTGKAAIVKIAPKNISKADLLIKPYGMVEFMLKTAANQTPYEIYKDWDKDLKAPIYDAEGYSVTDTLNAECIVKFNNIAADA